MLQRLRRRRTVDNVRELLGIPPGHGLILQGRRGQVRQEPGGVPEPARQPKVNRPAIGPETFQKRLIDRIRDFHRTRQLAKQAKDSLGLTRCAQPVQW